jgi:RNA polymerase sigma-70 factor (ECF subfamily)
MVGWPKPMMDCPSTDWSELVEQHGPDVWRTAYRLLSNREDASDVYQETFLQAVEFARRQQVTCWPAVLKRIVTARSLDQLRRRYRAAARRESFAAINEPAEVAPTPDGLAQLREGMELLRQAMTELPSNHAEVFWLCEVEMLSHTDIAKQLDATTEQVSVWLHRAKKKLRTLLTARGVLESIQS